jgi:hypothetical protein
MGHSRKTRRCGGRALIAGIAVICGVAVYVVWFDRRDEQLPTTAEVMAATDAGPTDIAVGPNVQVSTGNASIGHKEVVVASDPTNPRRLFAAAIFHPHTDRPLTGIIGYRTDDGGATWQPGIRRDDPRLNQMDPTVAYGPAGELYLAVLTRPATESDADRIVPHAIRFFGSPDGGAGWEDRAVVEGPHLDRPVLAVDGSRGRLYCASLQQFHASTDGGRTVSGLRYDVGASADAMNSNPVVLSDGTVVTAYRDWPADERVRPGLGVLASRDGGQTLRETARVAARWKGGPFLTFKFWFMPQLAADASSGPYRDRVYAVWEDGNGPGRGRLLFSSSSDQGRSWGRPTILSEQPADGDDGYGAYMPAIAVNPDGVVAVSWYDRRGLPDGANGPLSQDNLGTGCNVRLRVSLDGGDTWRPSVLVNDKPIRAKVWALRDTTGLAADAAGTFHPVWIDDRTGVLQVWTAAVRVSRPGP